MDRRIMTKGFTLTELLVVMAIVAILAGILVPATIKGRQKAYINKAKAELATLTSTAGMIYLDIGAYVRLADYDSIQTSAPDYGWNDSMCASTDGGDVIGTFGAGTSPTDTQVDNNWDGPYATYQPGATYSAANGSLPGDDETSTWDYTANGNDFKYGTPLDPWNCPYALAWNETEKVMIIYSAGPDKEFQTTAGATSPAANSDDLLYKFK